MLGVREGFLKVYECERALMRECQRHLREDALKMATLSEVKHGLKQDLAILHGKVRNFKADEWRSPHDELTNMKTRLRGWSGTCSKRNCSQRLRLETFHMVWFAGSPFASREAQLRTTPVSSCAHTPPAARL